MVRLLKTSKTYLRNLLITKYC